MMAKDMIRVCDNYEYKLRTGRMPTRRDHNHVLQAEKFRRAFARYEDVRVAVGLVASRFGVHSIWFPFYYDFGRTLARMQDRWEITDVQRREARMQLELWVSRGLVREVLEAVAQECFQLDLTGPIPTLAPPPEPT
jgi:hypothetical protein